MNSPLLYPLFVSCPKGLQYVLEQELQSFGVVQTKAIPSGVHGNAPLAIIYRCLMWSRLANRLILIVEDAKVESVEDLYESALAFPWQEHFDVSQSFSVSFLGTNNFIRNSTFGAQKVKDAIVDSFRKRCDQRPNVSRHDADIQVTARLNKGRVSFGLDLSGDSLHMRSYRQSTGPAPIKENLAFGLLTLGGWTNAFETDAQTPILDPMCGSGTILVEAALYATDCAPALSRQSWGFDHWKGHDPELWASVKREAEERFAIGKEAFSGAILGFDHDARVIKSAWENIRSAGMDGVVHVECCAAEKINLPEKLTGGFVISNPPYGQRLGDKESVKLLYKELGRVFESHFMNWNAAIITSDLGLGRELGWKSHKQYKVFNGALESTLLLFQLAAENRYKSAWISPEEKLQDPEQWKVFNAPRAEMFKNRLLKNQKVIGKWARKNKVSCYRVYDADMPEFSVALDIYEDLSGLQWWHVQEYAAPASVDPKSATQRLSEVLCVIKDLSDCGGERIALKSRSIQKGSSQYTRKDSRKRFIEVNEGDAVFRVNLFDYLDTGLFLDHRAARRWVNKESAGKTVLNLFCYTAAVTVAAAKGGARSTLSVDMSNTYLSWAQRNFERNGLQDGQHKLLQADCLEWLKTAKNGPKYDLVFLDPPSFSNSKKMESTLDIQRDHPELIEHAMSLLTKDGVLLFSCNLRKFKLEDEISSKYSVENWQKNSLDKDFERRANIHHCWLIRHKA